MIFATGWTVESYFLTNRAPGESQIQRIIVDAFFDGAAAQNPRTSAFFQKRNALAMKWLLD
jgi:predicted RNA-binding protein with PUA domain